MYPIISLGEGAELIAEEMQITREEQDAYALESHRRAIDALNSGRFAEEITPVAVPQRRGDPVLVDTDEHPRYTRRDGKFEIAITAADLGRSAPGL